MQQHKLESDPFGNEKDRNRIFGFADGSLLGPAPIQLKLVGFFEVLASRFSFLSLFTL